MRPGKHAQSAVITYTVGTMVGALCLAAERSGVPYALVMAFAVGPAILVARWTLARWSLRALKRDAKKAGASWPEGISVRDGWLCYTKDGFAWFRTPPLRRTDRDFMLSAPPFVDPKPLMASVAQVMDESRRQHERSFASMEATPPDNKPDHEGPKHEILQRLTDTSPALVNFPSSFIRLSNGEFFDLAAPDFDGRTNQGLIAPPLQLHENVWSGTCGGRADDPHDLLWAMGCYWTEVQRVTAKAAKRSKCKPDELQRVGEAAAANVRVYGFRCDSMSYHWRVMVDAQALAR